MSELYFRAGETEGFTSKKLADKKEGYANPIRELLQNSLDASKEAKNEKCEVDIYIEQIDKKDIPHINDYENILSQVIKYHKKENSYGKNTEQTVAFIKNALKQKILGVLMFVDNGIGMSPKILNGLIGERSVKSNESSGGSFGVGHLSSYFLSSLRYVLYASKYKKNGAIKTLFSGSPILAGYEDKYGIPRGSIGRILKQTPDNELKPSYIFPEIFPNFMQPKMDEIETGSMVTILGLNNDWSKEANYAIASNFFYAIYKNKLVININHGNIPIIMDKDLVDHLLEQNKDGKMATGDKILANQYIYQSWLTVKDSDFKKNIDLDNGDEVCVHIRNDIETDSVIALVRNGMLIARHDRMLSNDLNNLKYRENFKPFSIVINVDEVECPELFALVKGAENPYHNKLVKRLLPKEEKQLKTLFKELSEKIKEQYLEEKNRDGFNLSIPLLEIPNKAEAQGSNTNRPQSQTSKAKSNPSPNPSPPPHPPKICPKCNQTPCVCPKPPPRPKPIIISRSLVSKNAVRLKDNGDTFNVELSVTPSKIEGKDIVYLSMSLAQDSDKNEVGPGLDFINLSIDGNAIEIPDFIEIDKDGVIEKEEADKSQIRLGKLSAGQTYDIKATIKKPKTIKDVGVSLRPFLGLRQRK